MKFAFRSLLHRDPEEVLELYQLGRYGGVVRQGVWRERQHDGPEYDSVEDSWVEIELDPARITELETHVRQLEPDRGRPGFRGIMVRQEMSGDLVEYRPGHWRRFIGAERLEWRITVVNDWMD